MLNGQVFKNQLFENQIFALFINSLYNGKCGILNGYLNSMNISNTSSTITISSGACCIKGRFLEEDTETTIDVSPDTAYNILVIEIDLDKENTEEEFRQAYYKVVRGLHEYPILTQEHIENTNSGVYQFELARFRTNLNGIYDMQVTSSGLDYDSIYQMVQDTIDSIVDGSAFATRHAFEEFQEEVQTQLENAHPIGSIYLSMVSTNPSQFFGGTWTRIAKGKVLVGVDENDTDFNNSNKSGGAKTVALTTNQMPSHSHGVTDNGHRHNWGSNGVDYGGDYFGVASGIGRNTTQTLPGSTNKTGISIQASGGGQAHNNMQPFLTCYIFQRTA